VVERIKVLILSGESPLPATTGVRLRVLHLARQLAGAFDVDLLALGQVPRDVDEPFALRGVPHSWGRMRPLLGSLNRPYMAAKLDSSAARELAAGAAPATAQAELPFLVPAAQAPRAPVVLDAHNVETELLRSLSANEPNVGRRLRWRWETAKTARFESAVARGVEAVCVTSDLDAAVFERWQAREVVVVPNGVDTKAVTYQEPAASSQLVYIGNFGYRPNVLAARELADEILPRVQRSHPTAAVNLIGPGSEPLAASVRPGVETTGEVRSTLPYLHAAGAVVVPLRAGSGTRLKILESMAAGTPVVATPLAAAGLGVRDGEELLLGDSPTDLAAQVARLLSDPALARSLSATARALVEQKFDWSVVARPLVELHARLGGR
jgi:glycosyltransferase involved in cell wall biosynthesis